jgi:hypothetical protein
MILLLGGMRTAMARLIWPGRPGPRTRMYAPPGLAPEAPERKRDGGRERENERERERDGEGGDQDKASCV